MNAKYTTAEYVAAGAMHTMKVLPITLLACAVTVIQPVEAQCKCKVRLIRIFIFLQTFGYIWLIVHCFRSLFFL